MNTFFDNSFNKNVVTIHPGELYVSNKDELISTVLGSCVAVVLYDAKNGVGGMNHFMLPEKTARDVDENTSAPITRFGDQAIKSLIEEMVKAGAEKENLEAKVFGGGNVFNLQESATRKNVGDSNINYAHKKLAALHIPIVSEECGGIISRKIYFNPQTFKVLLKKIKNE